MEDCEAYCESHHDECPDFNFEYGGLYGEDMAGLLNGGKGPGPESSPSRKPEPNAAGIVLPLLLVTFFCCFVFQTYQKNGNRRGGVRTATHESEGINLVSATYTNARKFVSNRAADAIDRRRDARLADNDFSRNTDPDEDTML